MLFYWIYSHSVDSFSRLFLPRHNSANFQVIFWHNKARTSKAGNQFFAHLTKYGGRESNSDFHSAFGQLSLGTHKRLSRHTQFVIVRRIAALRNARDLCASTALHTSETQVWAQTQIFSFWRRSVHSPFKETLGFKIESEYLECLPLLSLDLRHSENSWLIVQTLLSVHVRNHNRPVQHD